MFNKYKIYKFKSNIKPYIVSIKAGNLNIVFICSNKYLKVLNIKLYYYKLKFFNLYFFIYNN